MIFTTPQNPWGLTQCEVDTVDAMARTGNAKLAASLRGCTQRTVNSQMAAAREKMGAANAIMAVQAWNDLRRGA